MIKYSLLGIYLVATIIFSFFYVFLRKDYYIAKRAYLPNMCSMVLQYFIVVIIITREMSKNNYPCFLMMWTNNFFIPSFIYSACVAPCLSLAHEFYTSKWKLENMAQPAHPVNAYMQQMHNAYGYSNYGNSIIKQDDSTSDASKSTDDAILLLDDDDNFPYFFEWTSNLFNRLILKKHFTLATIVIVLSIHAIATLVINCTFYEYSICPMYTGFCPANREAIFSHICLAFHVLFLCPAVCNLLITVDDALRIKRGNYELAITGFVYYVVLLIKRRFPDTIILKRYLPTWLVILLLFLWFQIITIWYPIIYVLKGRRQSVLNPSAFASTEQITLDYVFNDSVQYARFKEFSVRELSIENVYFLESLKRYKQLFAASNIKLYNQSIDLLRKDSAEKMERTFLCSDSVYQLNLTDSDVSTILARLRANEYNENTFEEAEESVMSYLTCSTFPRFLSYMKNEMKGI